MGNHISIEPIPCFVNTKLLYNFEDHEGDDRKQTPATITAICLYKGDAPCVDLLLEDGSMFAYMPLSLIATNARGAFVGTGGLTKRLELQDLVYHNAKSDNAQWSVIEHLKAGGGVALMKRQNAWVNVRRYLGTLDWIDDNDLLHLVELQTHQLAFLPSHKILFGRSLNDEGVPKFAKYKKQRNTWRVR